LTAIAIPWFVLVTTGSAARTGLVAFAGTVPIIIAGVLGGAIVDRIGYKRSSVVSDIASGLTVAMIPTLHYLGWLEFWHLLVLAFFGALLDVPGWVARNAMIPALAQRVGMPLERINAAMQIATTAASVLGPALAGILIATLGEAAVLYIDAASFAVSATIIGAFVVYPHIVRVTEATGLRATFVDAMEGVRFFVADRFLAKIMVISVVANFVVAPLFSVLFPSYVKELFDRPQALGFLAAAFGAGSVIGTVAYGAVGPRVSRYPVLLGSIAAVTAGLWVFPWSSSLVLSIGGGLVIGLAVGPMNVVGMTIIQERVPQGMLGRVTGALIAISQLAVPVSVLLAGFGVETFGVRAPLAVAAGIFTIVAIYSFIDPIMRQVDRPVAVEVDDLAVAPGRPDANGVAS
jgi:MFS family permease